MCLTKECKEILAKNCIASKHQKKIICKSKKVHGIISIENWSVQYQEKSQKLINVFIKPRLFFVNSRTVSCTQQQSVPVCLLFASRTCTASSLCKQIISKKETNLIYNNIYISCLYSTKGLLSSGCVLHSLSSLSPSLSHTHTHEHINVST